MTRKPRKRLASDQAEFHSADAQTDDHDDENYEEARTMDIEANGAVPQQQREQEDEDEDEEDEEYVVDDEEEDDGTVESDDDVFFDENDSYDDEDLVDDDDGYASASPPPAPPTVYLPHPSPQPSEGQENPFPDRPVRVYADGIYDLFHFGHARSLEQAKKSFPNTYLLVGCCSDAVTHMYKGKTVMTDVERYESLRHCKWVDEVIPDAPWVITQEFLDKHKIDFVAHDALPYADTSGSGKDVYEFVKAAGKFKETKRTDGISTSDIIMRILKDYNEYVMRNLARGYSRKDLGVSYVKEKQLRVNMGITKLRQKVKEQQERVGQKLNIIAIKAALKIRQLLTNSMKIIRTLLIFLIIFTFLIYYLNDSKNERPSCEFRLPKDILNDIINGSNIDKTPYLTYCGPFNDGLLGNQCR